MGIVHPISGLKVNGLRLEAAQTGAAKILLLSTDAQAMGATENRLGLAGHGMGGAFETTFSPASSGSDDGHHRPL